MFSLSLSLFTSYKTNGSLTKFKVCVESTFVCCGLAGNYAFILKRRLRRMFLGRQQRSYEAHASVRSNRDFRWAVTPTHVKATHAEALRIQQFRFYLGVIDVVESSAAVQQRRMLISRRIIVVSSGCVAVAHTHAVTAVRHVSMCAGDDEICTMLSAKVVSLRGQKGAVAVEKHTCPNDP